MDYPTAPTTRPELGPEPGLVLELELGLGLGLVHKYSHNRSQRGWTRKTRCGRHSQWRD